MSPEPQISNSFAVELRRITDEFAERWRRGERPDLRALINGYDAQQRDVLLQELLVLEVTLRREAGEQAAAGDYAPNFPELTDFLAWIFSSSVRVGPSTDGARTLAGVESWHGEAGS